VNLHDYYEPAYFIDHSLNKLDYLILGMVAKQSNSQKNKKIEVLGIVLYNICGDENENN
jgi:hypothetical protein